MEEGADSGKFPKRPQLGPRPAVPPDGSEPEETPKEERMGDVYYRVNSMQRQVAEQQPVRRHSSMGGRGVLWLVVLGAAAYYFYKNPNAVTSAINGAGQWVQSTRGKVFSEGKGYGELPEEGKDSQ